MKKEDCIGGIKVIYTRGIRLPLIGKHGVIESLHEYDSEIVMVKFEGYEHVVFPIHISNLEIVEE
jgi:hypothetical protein